MSNRNFILLGALAGLLLLARLFGIVGPSFVPDRTFKGSSLAGWHTLGQADWRAQDGVLIGTPKQAGGGWLVLDQPFQDTGFYASFKCFGGCKTGVLLRAEKTVDGMKGVYVSLNDGDVNSYALTLDS